MFGFYTPSRIKLMEAHVEDMRRTVAHVQKDNETLFKKNQELGIEIAGLRLRDACRQDLVLLLKEALGKKVKSK